MQATELMPNPLGGPTNTGTIYGDLRAIHPVVPAPDQNFRETAEGMYRDLMRGIHSAPPLPKDWADRIYTSLHIIKMEQKIRETFIVISGPLDFTVDDCHDELCLLALVILRYPRALLWMKTTDYEWQLEGTREIAEHCADWAESMTPDERDDWEKSKIIDMLQVSGLLPDWLEQHFNSIMVLGLEWLDERAEARGRSDRNGGDCGSGTAA